MVTADWTGTTAWADWRAPLWTAGQWVHLRAVWDTTMPTDSLQLYVNGTRVDSGAAAGGWSLGEDYVVRRVGDLSLVSGLDTSQWNAPRWLPAAAKTAW